MYHWYNRSHHLFCLNLISFEIKGAIGRISVLHNWKVCFKKIVHRSFSFRTLIAFRITYVVKEIHMAWKEGVKERWKRHGVGEAEALRVMYHYFSLHGLRVYTEQDHTWDTASEPIPRRQWLVNVLSFRQQITILRYWPLLNLFFRLWVWVAYTRTYQLDIHVILANK